MKEIYDFTTNANGPLLTKDEVKDIYDYTSNKAILTPGGPENKKKEATKGENTTFIIVVGVILAIVVLVLVTCLISYLRITPKVEKKARNAVGVQ